MKIVVTWLAGVLALAGCTQESLSDLHGTLLIPSIEVQDYAFESASGTRHLSDFRGKYIVIAFGYTYCPDACPTTMNRLARVIDLVEEKASQVQVMLVSVDPDRDSPATLEKYAQTFNQDFIGVHASKENPEEIFKKFGIYHAVSDSASGENYLIDHSTSTLVLDTAGRWRLVWRFDLTPDEMASDLLKLIRAQ